MRVSNKVYGGMMGVGVLGLTLLSFAQSGAKAEATTSSEGLVIDVTERPTPCYLKSQKGDKLSMHYDGKLDNGTPFDSSRKRGRPFEFTLGAGQVIQGWDKGLNDMCVGEKRTLTIPSALGYGSRGAGGVIPGGATLVFDVELLDIPNADASRKNNRDEL